MKRRDRKYDPEKVTAKLEEITPLKAAKWLQDGSTANVRNVCHAEVRVLAKAIQSGDFPVTGESIIFDEDGTLVDGQHRLEAVVLADKAIQSVVVRGVRRAAEIFVDSGRRRTASQVLAKLGFTNSAILAAVSRLCILYDRYGVDGVYGADGVGGKNTIMERVPVQEIVDYCYKNKEDLEWACSMAQQGRPMFPMRFAGFILFMGERKLGSLTGREEANSLATSFAEALGGNGLKTTDALFHLRERLTKETIRGKRGQVKRTPVPRVAAYMVSAWNQWVRGRPACRLLTLKAGRPDFVTS